MAESPAGQRLRGARWRRVARSIGIAATAGIAASVFVGVGAAVAAEPELPPVIPSVSEWSASGQAPFVVGDDLDVAADPDNARLVSSAEILAAELGALWDEDVTAVSSADAGDIELRLDSSRSDDLGEEGYELTIGDRVTVTAAAEAGAFYGSRTVLQMLMQQRELPAGTTIDIPAFEERGVTLCACVINVSTDWIDRLLEEMSFLKLNQLLVELKVKVDAYPETNTWSYYTKDDIRALVEKASAYNIDVIPEINSPGHMEIWLENLPDLQLVNPTTGAKDEVRLDITKDAAFDFYTDLIDEYSEVFTSDYWHMGADEYMLGSGYANYPQVAEFAKAQWGAGATANDVVAWYINKVNAYVKSQGKQLRIWNDGVMVDTQKVEFDTDITVEHWNQAGSSIRPQTFLDWGHRLMNASNALYMVRGGYGVDTKGLYNSAWNVGKFYGQAVDANDPLLTGAKFSMWPDGGTPSEAENTTEARMFEALRFVAQSTWTTDRPWADYDAFLADMKTIDRPPLWENIDRAPIAAGSYTLATDGGAMTVADGTAVLGEGTALTVTPTADQYYTITDTAGKCLDVARTGTMRLNVPVEIGADVRFAACDGTTVQKWQIVAADGGYTIVNAASQQHLSVSSGLVDVPVSHQDPKTVPDGRIVQTPRDWGATVWKAEGRVSLAVSGDAALAAPGDSITATVTLSNGTAEDVADATLSVSNVPAGWTALPASIAVGALAPGESMSHEVTLFNVSAPLGAAEFGFALHEGDQVLAQASLALGARCAATTVHPTAVTSFSSQQASGEPAGSGVASAIVDGDVTTYWHSQWSPTEPKHPHAVVVDLGEAVEICGIVATPRTGSSSGAVNGRIADYAVYTSNDALAWDAEGWGDAAATGTWSNGAAAQTAVFEAREARYVKLVSLSEINGNAWATLAELEAIGPFTPPATYDELAVQAPSGPLRLGTAVSLEIAGAAPGELVEVHLGRRGDAPIAIGQAGADGSAVIEATIPADAVRGRQELTVHATTTGQSAAASVVIAGGPVRG